MPGRLRVTRTFAIMELSPAAYAEVRAAIVEAGYDHALLDEDGEVINMDGIAVRAKEKTDG